MASYSMEDVEFIRGKSGISYEEAVSMLDYHNGDVARVLIDLERSGRLNGAATQKQPAAKETGKGRNKFMNFIQKMYRTRVKVKKGDTVIINLSVLFTALAVILFSPHLTILSLILGLLLGYRISIDTDDEAFREERIENLVKNAGNHVKNAVNDISRGFTDAAKKKEAKSEAKAEVKTEVKAEIKSEPKAEVKVDLEKEAAAPVTEPATEKEPVAPIYPLSTEMPDLSADIIRDLEMHEKGPNVPVIQIPVKVESTDGNVEVIREADGTNTVTIG